jgi:hypothetical protein
MTTKSVSRSQGCSGSGDAQAATNGAAATALAPAATPRTKPRRVRDVFGSDSFTLVLQDLLKAESFAGQVFDEDVLAFVRRARARRVLGWAAIIRHSARRKVEN